jgi:hypothetical protein
MADVSGHHKALLKYIQWNVHWGVPFKKKFLNSAFSKHIIYQLNLAFQKAESYRKWSDGKIYVVYLKK